MLNSFLWGAGGQKMTPEQVEQQRKLAALAQSRAGDTSPVGHWTQGAARVVDALGGVLRDRRTSKAETAGMESADEYVRNDPVLASLVGGGGSSGSPVGADPIRSGLIARGLPEHVADAFVMNFKDESGLDPSINEISPLVPGSRGGFGLAQWTGPRRRALEAFAQERGAGVDDVDTQLDFLMQELQGPEAAAAQSIFAAPDTGSAAAAIVNKFLRPAEEHRARRVAAYTGGQSQPSGDVIAALTQGMSNPWVAKKYGPVMQALMGNEMQMQQAARQQQLRQQDPLYQAQLARMTAPAAADPWADIKIIDGKAVRIGENGPEVVGDFSTPETAPTPITPEQRAAWGIPADDNRPYAMTPDGPKLIGGGGVTVNNDMGGGKFEEAFAKGDAAMLGTVAEGGLAAQRNLGRINQLEQLLSQSPSGLAGAAKLAAGEWGINTEGLSEIQAAQALINSLVPEQRQPGSGPMSDADLALFKQSLPRIINQPGGNATIIQTMRAIAQYDAEGAAIVQKLRAGEIDRAQAFAALQSRQNPLEGFKAPGEQASTGAGVDFSSMGIAEIGQVDIGSLTPEQMDALEARMAELGL